jgi:hypothetical protein
MQCYLKGTCQSRMVVLCPVLQVFRCQDIATKKIVAIKVVKNKPAYRNQALIEIQVRVFSTYSVTST